MPVNRACRALLVLALATSTPLAAAGAAAAGDDDNERGRVVWTNAPDNTFSQGHLISARPGGQEFRQLTPATPGVNDIDASTSPDGERIVYERDQPDGSSGLRIVGAAGQRDHAVALGCTDPCVADLTPSWLVNGRISFTRIIGPFDAPHGSAHSAALYTAKADGTDVRRLSGPGIDGAFEDYHARVAPDGSYITFERTRDADGARALFRMAPDGTHVRQLTPHSLNAGIYDLSLARSGQTKDLLVFDTFRAGQTSSDVATVPATCTSPGDCTSKVCFLTHNAGASRRNANPTWRPDGRRIAFTDRASIAAEDANILTMRFDGTDRHQVSRSPLFDYRPDWGGSD